MLLSEVIAGDEDVFAVYMELAEYRKLEDSNLKRSFFPAPSEVTGFRDDGWLMVFRPLEGMRPGADRRWHLNHYFNDTTDKELCAAWLLIGKLPLGEFPVVAPTFLFDRRLQ